MDTIVTQLTSLVSDRNATIKIAAVPGVVSKINRALESADVEFDDIAAIVQTEPALVARVMRAANSALLCLPQCTSLREAVSRLGMAVVRNMAICVSLKDAVDPSVPVLAEALTTTAHNTSQVATIMGALCCKRPPLKADTAVLMGMVCNFGKLVIIRMLDDMPCKTELAASQVHHILTLLNVRAGRPILIKWGMTAGILDGVFSQPTKVASPDDIATYKDAFTITRAYLDKTLPEESMKRVTSIVDENKQDVEEFLRIFA